MSKKIEEMKLARNHQAGVERSRLLRHRALALRIRTASEDDRDTIIADARAEVERWKSQQLCSEHYIDRWTEALKMKPRELAIYMMGDMDGWGDALRQNSPFLKAPPP